MMAKIKDKECVTAYNKSINKKQNSIPGVK